MPSSELSRALTASLAIIRFTRKWRPMSRRNSSADSCDVQSRLLTMVAAFSPSKSRNGSICRRIRSTHSATVSTGLILRSESGFGSPISPVAPPTSASGRWPASCSRRAARICTRLPEVQARRRGVEADVVRDRPLRQLRAQRVQVGGERDEPAPLQFVDRIGHAGDCRKQRRAPARRYPRRNGRGDNRSRRSTRQRSCMPGPTSGGQRAG